MANAEALPAEFVEAVGRALAATLLREMAEKPEPQPQTEEKTTWPTNNAA